MNNKRLVSVSLFILLLELQLSAIVQSIIPRDKDGMSPCHSGILIVADKASHGGKVTATRCNCSVFHPLDLTGGRICMSWDWLSGHDRCHLYITNDSWNDCKSRLNVSGCSTGMLQDNSSGQILFTNRDFTTSIVEPALMHCAGRSLNTGPVTSDCSKTGGEVSTTTRVESTQRQIVGNGIVVHISLSIVAAIFVLALVVGFGYAYRRKTQKSSKSHTSRSKSESDENAISPYYETSTEVYEVVYENSNATQLDNQRVVRSQTERSYIEPEITPPPATTKRKGATTSAERVYANSPSYCKPVEITGGGYLSPIPRQFIDGESGYQHPVKK